MMVVGRSPTYPSFSPGHAQMGLFGRTARFVRVMVLDRRYRFTFSGLSGENGFVS
jgi:hypothetical protein